MYICPTCGKEIKEEAAFVKHYATCWKEENPNYKSKNAPHSEDIILSRTIDENVLSFFNSFNGGSNGKGKTC